MSARTRLRAAFYRGGTSKAVLFNGADLPKDRAVRDRLFLHILGSPDPYGRQLNGLGGGLSSVSKVVLVEPSTHPDADVDYTFVQIAVGEPVADYGSTCGNMSSAVGPFAVEEGLLEGLADGTGPDATVRIHNTNTGQIYVARFPIDNGLPVEEGDFEIPGVAGAGAKVQLDFLDPGGAATNALLPTGKAQTRIAVDGVGDVIVSFVDAANPVAFVLASNLGTTCTEAPAELDADTTLMNKLDVIRRAAGVAAGMATSAQDIPLSNPKVAMVAPPAPFTALDGRAYTADQADIAVRLVSMGNMHRAITLTGGMCVAVAARIPETLVQSVMAPDALARLEKDGETLRIANPSGILPVAAKVDQMADGALARSATTYRTQRRIMEGSVLVPTRLMEEAPA